MGEALVFEEINDNDEGIVEAHNIRRGVRIIGYLDKKKSNPQWTFLPDPYSEWTDEDLTQVVAKMEELKKRG